MWQITCGLMSASGVDDFPNATRRIICDVKRAVGSDGEAARAPIRSCTTAIGTEAVGERIVCARSPAAADRLEYDAVTSLRFGSSIPGSMESDEHAATVL